MGEVYFYQLTRRSVEAMLPPLLDRALSQGWRVAVRGTDAGRLEHLDEALWLGPKEGFLPHGIAGGPHDARQPVLLTTEEGEAPNRADMLVSVDGADLTADEVRAHHRSCVVFDGEDKAALATARAQWKALTDAGAGARYWSEESGRWVEKAAKNVGGR